MTSLFQRAQYFVSLITAAATHQTDLQACHRLIEGLAHEIHAVGTRRLVARARPCVRHHVCLADEGHEQMLRVAPFALGGCSLC